MDKKAPPGDAVAKPAETTGRQRRDPPLMLSVLRELRAEVTDLSTLIGKVKNGATSVAANASYIEKTVADVETLITEINELNAKKRSDTVRHINNCWEQMQVNPVLVSPAEDRPPQEQLHELTLLEEQAAQIVLAIGHQTIPHRLNRWLDKARPGYYLPFHLLFEDELPSPEDRKRVLNSIAWAPDALRAGIVDTSSGLIYRYEATARERWRSFGVVVMLYLLATLLVMKVGIYHDFLGLAAPTDGSALRTLMIGWAAVLVGVLVHMAVARFKRDKDSGLPPVIAVNDWLIYLSAHKGDILGKLAFALIGLFGLIFTVGLDKTTTTSAFLVGYSLDSFVGLFGSSLEQKASAQLNALRGQKPGNAAGG